MLRLRVALMANWIKEGAAVRSAAQIVPVRHLLVDDNGSWSLWCSGGKGRPQTAVAGNKRFCRGCLTLANEAIEDETLTPDSVQGWPVKAPA
jgi:hypothetical protein